MNRNDSHQDMIWHDDGHTVSLRINRAELEVVEVSCPQAPDKKCNHDEFGCIVQYFIYRYGMECNAGSCLPTPQIEICWTLLGDPKNIDMSQVWFMPKTDELFSAWLIAKKSS